MHNALLSGNTHDQLAIAYHLIVDNKRIEDETSKLDTKDFQFHITSSPPPFFDNMTKLPSRQRVLSCGNSVPERQRTLSGNNSDRNRSTTPMKKAKWHLGKGT